RGKKDAKLRIPPREEEMTTFFANWAAELASCRKFAPSARNYAAAKLMADVGWDLGRFGKLHIRYGKGSRGTGPKERMVPLVNDAGTTLRWFIEEVWGQFDDDHTRHGAPLFPSERKNTDGSCA